MAKLSMRRLQTQNNFRFARDSDTIRNRKGANQFAPFMALIISTFTNLSPSYFMRLPTLVAQPVAMGLPAVSKI